MKKLSILMPALNQGRFLRETCESARKALGDWKNFEMLVWDDTSTDGCADDLPDYVTVFRGTKRKGCSGSRVALAAEATGDIFLWADPHCLFPEGCFPTLIKRAIETRGFVEPYTTSGPGRWRNRPRHGGRLILSSRGLRNKRMYGKTPRWPSALGTVYCMTRKTYERRIGGWPHLPGFWGASEQAITLSCWFRHVPIVLEPSICCHHRQQTEMWGVWKFKSPDGKHGFRVSRRHEMMNRHWIHAAYFPRSYECFWRPKLIQHFADDPRSESYGDCVNTDRFKVFAAEVERHKRRTEEEFFRAVLEMEPPAGMLDGKPERPTDEAAYLRIQNQRSAPHDSVGRRRRLRRHIDWLFRRIKDLPRNVLDLGTREGFALDRFQEHGVNVVEGLDITPEAVKLAREGGRNVKQGDMRSLPYADASWDMVSAIHSLEHAWPPSAALKEMNRVLKPRGHLFVAVPLEADNRDRAHVALFPTPKALVSAVRKHINVERESWAIRKRHHGQIELLYYARKKAT